ncbi:PREDICTED: uncharacterized protein LOC105557047, partial [Vollenhovia emeryi]|uniref:uncharacterized protein LOC105557047 n=1 Tax=Vollenhovia emeryi TaxID=411798 RepID=UPI0005F40B17
MPRLSSKVTKRTVLSVIAQIFDPLGLVGPATVKAKLLLQRLWQLNLDWDESLPQDLHHKWIAYVAELGSLNDIVVPRVIICSNPELVELHGFSDASEGAYGACVYLRSINREGVVTIRLICAKSKVAPLKTICIPRLELCGALLLSNLAKSVSQALTIPLTNRYYWCDSTIVLAWIRGEPHLRKTFVANRLTEIQQMTDQEQWHYVKSEHNPADVISRGISPKQLKDLHLWWHGPEWLVHPEEYLQQPIPTPAGTDLETKRCTVLATQTIEASRVLERYSSLSRLKRVIAYCLRWRNNHKFANERHNGPLTVSELDQAMATILRRVQLEGFSREIQDLRSKERVNHDSSLLTLCPFLDGDGLLR